jgi:hypothetical protein
MIIQSQPAKLPPASDHDRLRFQELKQEFDQLDYFCKGTVLKRMMKCGKPQCACHRDPSKRHGPYFELTYKRQGTTVNVKLRAEQVAIYKAASQQFRKLKSLITRLERVSRTALTRQAKKMLSPPAT